jgi:purine-binding chemotaxis protein CheW
MEETLTEQSTRTVLLSTFYVRDALCALDASGVQGVIRLGAVTRIPHAPEQVAGVINLRGKIVTLLDAGIILGFGKTVATPKCRVFILEHQGEFFGLLVDDVGEVITAESDESEPLPANVPLEQARYFQHLCRSGGRVIAVLNPVELLGEKG